MKFCVRRILQLITLLLPWYCVLSVRADVFDHPLGTGDNAIAFSTLTAEVQRQERVAGIFTQTKHLQMLDRPLVTQGRFSLSRTAFEWHIEFPFALSYQFAGQQLTREADGAQQIIQPAAEPALYGFFSFFTSLFNLSQEQLEKVFKVFFLPADDTWELGLIPIQPQLAKAVQRLHITGSGSRIHLVKLTEVNGDRTEMAFSYPDPTPVP